jgi:RNA polymerase sigma-70 factor (ECF subfamily)
VIKSLPRFRQDSSFKTWLFRLAYHHLSNLRRRLRTHLDERHDATPDELWEELLPAPGESAESALASGETRELLRHCLVRLPEIERAVILGRYYHETTLQELTDELKLTNASGARAYLIAGQRKLRRCMERLLAEQNHE